MRRSRYPAVYVDIEIPDHWIRVSISNQGSSAAKNISFEIEDPLPWGKDVGLKKLDVFSKGITYLPPGRTLKYRIGRIDWKGLTDDNSNLRILIKYENEQEKKVVQEYFFDIRTYYSVLLESFRDPNLEVAKAIKESDRNRQSSQSSFSWINKLKNSIGKKNCPMCGELILANAKKCRYCHEFIANDRNDEPTDKSES